MIWPFGRAGKTALELLKRRKWTCASCKKAHAGIFDIGCDAPDPWAGIVEMEPNAAIRLEGNCLTPDFCVVEGEHFMVRCVLPIPVHGIAENFSYGVWGSLRRENFETYVRCFDDNDFKLDEPWWSWLCNTPKPFVGEESVGCWMHPQANHRRPKLLVADEDHPLAVAQSEGISPEQLLEIYATYGHSPAH